MLGIYSLTSVLNCKHKTHTYLRCHRAPMSLGCRPITHLNHHAQNRTQTYHKLRYFSMICVGQHPTMVAYAFVD